MRNKDHWYDGFFYDRIIAPNQDTLFKHISRLLQPGSTVIDVGCGTGRFAFAVADTCGSVVGMDLSKKNIDRALSRYQKKPIANVSFRHTDVATILLEGKDHFDFAVMTYVIHEVDIEERVQLIQDLAKIADRIIIGDYIVPRKSGFWDVLSELVEFVAGRDHYKNFKSYVAEGGIAVLARKAGCRIVTEISNRPSTSHIAVLECR